tara:strand:- start:464 stop:835 length:372 start_codon:yes stop_codon:yes gene_type:complete
LYFFLGTMDSWASDIYVLYKRGSSELNKEIEEWSKIIFTHIGVSDKYIKKFFHDWSWENLDNDRIAKKCYNSGIESCKYWMDESGKYSEIHSLLLASLEFIELLRNLDNRGHIDSTYHISDNK